MHSRGRTLLTWILATAVCAAQIGFYPVRAQGTPGADGGRDATAVAAEVERLFDALAAAAAEIPRDTFDPEAILAVVGPDPLELFAWVRDETDLVAYRGALRGPVGVLMDRKGNALDRALLLADLLQRAGHDARLVRATLSVEEARRLLDDLASRPRRQAAPLADDTWSRVERHARTFDLDLDALRATYEASRAADAAMRAKMEHRVDAHTAFLLDAIGRPDPDPEGAQRMHATDLSDHWWVQASVAGAWLDLDPSLPRAVAGETITSGAGVAAATSLADLPDALQHALRLRVVLECAEAAGSVEHLLVESPVITPAKTLGEAISVRYVPVRLTDDADAAAGADDPAHVMAVLREQDEWFPVITIGATSYYDQEFSADCGVAAAAMPLPGASAAGAFGAAGGFLDAFGSPTTPGDDAADESIAALWLEYEIVTPGADVTLTRRAVFELPRGGPRDAGRDALAWRLALLGGTHVLPLFAQLSPAYVEHLSATRWLRHRANAVALTIDPEADGSPEPFGSTDLENLALVRRADVVGSDGAVFIRDLNVLTRHVQIGLDASGAGILIQAFDIVANDVGVTGGTPDAFAARVREGVADTNAEALVGASVCRQDAPQRIVCRDAGGTAEAFEATRETTEWIVLRTPSDAASLDTWSSVARERVRADLEAGFVVVAPRVPPSIDGSVWASWWRVDPTSGATLGMGENGWGTSLVEYSVFFALGFVACKFGSIAVGGGASNATCVFVGIGLAASAPTTVAKLILSAIAAGGAGTNL